MRSSRSYWRDFYSTTPVLPVGRRSRCRRSGHSVVPEQCIDTRRAAAKRNEGLERRPAAANGQDLVAEALPGIGIEYAAFLKKAERIGRQHFGPLVTVVTRGISAREYVREALRESIERRRNDDGDLAAHVGEQILHGRAALRIEVEMQMQIEQREFDLAHHVQTTLEIFGSQ